MPPDEVRTLNLIFCSDSLTDLIPASDLSQGAQSRRSEAYDAGWVKEIDRLTIGCVQQEVVARNALRYVAVFSKAKIQSRRLASKTVASST